MRYTLTGQYPRPVRYIRHEGQVISNPPDGLVDSLCAGYPLSETPLPEYDPDKQSITTDYALEDGIIVQRHTVVDLETPEPEANPVDLAAEIEQLREQVAILTARLESGPAPTEEVSTE